MRITVNGSGHELKEPVSVDTLVASMNIQTRGIAVAVNRDIVTRSTWDSQFVEESDVIEIITAAAGG